MADQIGSSLKRVAMISLHTSPTAALGRSQNGGLNVYVREVCAALSRRGVATDVFTRCSDGRECPAIEQLAPLSRVVYLAAGAPNRDKYELLAEVPAFIDHVEDFIFDSSVAYDLLYSHYWLSGLAACALQDRLHLPWAHMAHTLAVVKNRQLAPGADPEPAVRIVREGEIARCADLCVTSTPAEADDLRAAYGVRPEQIAVVAPGVDLDAFAPRDRSRARAAVWHEGHRLFVFAGRLEPLKGVDIILRAMALLTAGGGRSDVRLVVLGDDSGAGERARLEALAKELGIQERVCFQGSIDQHALPDYYAAAEACLMPSYSESFGLVGLEAQACGTAVIASNVAGLASVVRDGVTGFLVNEPDPTAYACLMARLLDEPGLAEHMGRSAHLRAQRFSWDRTADELLVHLGDLATPPRGGNS